MTLPHIESPKNPRILALSKLLDKKGRQKTGLFLIEGRRMVADAVMADAPIEEVYITEAAMKREGSGALMARWIASNTPICAISEEALRKISDTQSPQGMVAVVRRVDETLKRAYIPRNPLLIIADGVSDPGNLGALMRVAAAAGANAMILTPGCCDWTTPKTLRASMASAFMLPIITACHTELAEFLQKKEISLFCAAGREGASLYDVNVQSAMAIAFGNEGEGLSQEIRKMRNQSVHIPMARDVESLNVACAASVIIFELNRRRRKWAE